MPIFQDSQVATICRRSSIPGHHLEMHMWLIDRLEGYLKVQMWETWWVARDKGHFEWKPSNVKKLTKLIRRSASVLPKPEGMEYHMLKYLLFNANELTTMVYSTTM